MLEQIFTAQSADDANLVAELNIWCGFYLAFNDDNLEHLKNTYYNNASKFESAEAVHKANLEWILFLLENRSVDELEELLHNYLPEGCQYLREYLSIT